MDTDLKNTAWIATQEELESRKKIQQLFRNCRIPDNEVLANLGLFLNGPSLARILFMNDLYQRILSVHGIVIEFGVRWGQNMALFENFRGIYEPFNFTRRIIGFDTFQGFLSVDEKDGNMASANDFSVTPEYENYLQELLDFHEHSNPIPQIKKVKIIKGDAIDELKKYLDENPETIIALAYFDFDVYEPTKKCLELIQGYLTKGSIVGFDELCFHHYPGETLAYKEVFGLNKYKITRSQYSRANSFITID